MNRKFRMTDLLIKLLFTWNVLAPCLPLHAEWNPEEFLAMDSRPTNTLINRDFLTLKGRVMAALKSSWCSKEKINLLMDLVYFIRPEVCVEIGAFSGSSVLPVATILKLQNCGKIYAIDAWSNQEAVKYLAENDPNRTWWASVNMQEIRKILDQMIHSWHLNGICLPIQGSSKNAVGLVPEIDFLHLDGDYSEVGSRSDVALYFPKVKSGGYILLSNVAIIVNDEQPKLESFYDLLNKCELICEVDNSNAILFRKL